MKKRIFLFTLTSFIFFEIFMHFYGVIFSNYGIRDDRYGYRYFKNIQFVFNYNNELINFSTNNYGFRDKKWIFKNEENKKKIAVIGDSIVSALGTHQNRRFTEILENKLIKDKNKYQVLNMGINGQNVVNYINSTDSILEEINPDYIFLILSTTDDFVGNYHKTFLGSKKITYSIKKKEVVISRTTLNFLEIAYRKILIPIRQSSTINQLDKMINLIKFKLNKLKISLNEDKKERFKVSRHNKCTNTGFKPKLQIDLIEKILIDIKKITKKKLILGLSPSEADFFRNNENIINCKEKIHVFNWFNQFTKRHDIKKINIHNILNKRNKDNYFLDGAHLNDNGHKLVAEIIYKKIIEMEN